jgi:hypothetical protein
MAIRAQSPRLAGRTPRRKTVDHGQARTSPRRVPGLEPGLDVELLPATCQLIVLTVDPAPTRTAYR